MLKKWFLYRSIITLFLLLSMMLGAPCVFGAEFFNIKRGLKIPKDMLSYEGYTHLNVPQAEFTVNGYHLHFQDPLNLETTKEINILVPSNTRIVLLFRENDGIYENLIKYHNPSFNNGDIQRLINTPFHIIDYYLLVHEKDTNIPKDVFDHSNSKEAGANLLVMLEEASIKDAQALRSFTVLKDLCQYKSMKKLTYLLDVRSENVHTCSDGSLRLMKRIHAKRLKKVVNSNKKVRDTVSKDKTKQYPVMTEDSKEFRKYLKATKKYTDSISKELVKKGTMKDKVLNSEILFKLKKGGSDDFAIVHNVVSKHKLRLIGGQYLKRRKIKVN